MNCILQSTRKLKENTSAVSILLCIRVKTLLDSCIVANSLGSAHLNRFKSLAGSCINMIDYCQCISIGNCMLIPGLSLQIWNLVWVISWLYCGLLYLSEKLLNVWGTIESPDFLPLLRLTYSTTIHKMSYGIRDLEHSMNNYSLLMK